jgi:hypothetical protein
VIIIAGQKLIVRAMPQGWHFDSGAGDTGATVTLYGVGMPGWD